MSGIITSYNYRSRNERDRAALEYRRDGYRVRKSSSRNVMLSPDYVIDDHGSGCDNGFGGKSPEYYPVIYKLEVS